MDIKYIPKTVFFNFSFVHVVLNFIVEPILITSPEFNTIKKLYTRFINLEMKIMIK